jgi:hypothetical protein
VLQNRYLTNITVRTTSELSLAQGDANDVMASKKNQLYSNSTPQIFWKGIGWQGTHQKLQDRELNGFQPTISIPTLPLDHLSPREGYGVGILALGTRD